MVLGYVLSITLSIRAVRPQKVTTGIFRRRTAAYLVSLRHEQPYVVVSDGIRICIRCDTSSATHKYQQFQTPLPSDCYYAQRLCLSSMAQSLRDVKS
jgi:hypothetical protein